MTQRKTDHVRQPIHTFVLRGNRMTTGQRRALDRHWGDFGLDWDDTLPDDRYHRDVGFTAVVPDDARLRPLDPEAVFGRRAPLVLDIGFGMGETTAAMAAADPGRDILAVDLHNPGVGALLLRIVELGLTNVRIARGDARRLLTERIADDSLDEVRVYFSDPWPKARHHKRRLVRPDFVALVARKLAPGGRLHLATDWEDYAEQMREVLAADPTLVSSGFVDRPAWRPVTRFERAGLAKGHVVHDLFGTKPPADGGTGTGPVGR